MIKKNEDFYFNLSSQDPVIFLEYIVFLKEDSLIASSVSIHYDA